MDEQRVPRRAPRRSEAVALRVAEFLERDGGPRGACPVALKTRGGRPLGARSLNPGLFCLERMRAESVVKERLKAKRKVRGK